MKIKTLQNTIQQILKKEINMTSKNIYKDNYKKYKMMGLSAIPAKYGSKMPAIKGWSDYCYRMPTVMEEESWCKNFNETNIDIALGEASGIIALDLDCTDQKILDIIMPLLPDSPVSKVGAKGETRFFKFNGEMTDILKFNGEVVIELLSNNKKTTMVPSLHPSGVDYKWLKGKLSDLDKNKLPNFPPFLFSHLFSKLKLTFPDLANKDNKLNKIISGRNDGLSSLCGKLISEQKEVDVVIRELIEFDRKANEVPLFSDPEEMRHIEPYTNALTFYTNHLNSINYKRQRDNKEFEVPAMQTVADMEVLKELKRGKSQKREQLKSSKKDKKELVPAKGAMEIIHSTILKNSWIKQPELAFGASLTLLSTLVSRKLVFQGMSPNLYVLNISTSGSGKDLPQQFVKNTLIDIGADSLLGAGDYVSDASLMDSLEVRPTRLDVMDECGSILKTVNSGKGEYNGKMADILAELYTSSNGKFMGRATAEGNKGTCYRPNVNILGSTTPVGFSEGISIKAIEKGLMGRFLIFQGDSKNPAIRLRTFPKLPRYVKEELLFWYGFRPEDFNKEGGEEINGIPQNYIEIKATEAAEKKLDKIFVEFDELRVGSNRDDPKLPIVSRLYQQMIKLIIIAAVSRTSMKVPEINEEDVEFGYNTILYYFESIQGIIDKYIFNNNQERESKLIYNLILDNGGNMTKTELYRKTKSLNKRQRDGIIEDLIEDGSVIRDVQNNEGKNQVVFYVV